MEYYSVKKGAGGVLGSGAEVLRSSGEGTQCVQGAERPDNSLEAGRRLAPDATQPWGALILDWF